MIHSSTYQRC